MYIFYIFISGQNFESYMNSATFFSNFCRYNYV